MAKLIIKKLDHTFSSIELEEGQLYSVGRGADCDIVLENVNGLSRKHFQLSFADGFWQIEVVSRFGTVNINNEDVANYSVESNTEFKVSEYTFIFILEEVAEAVIEAPEGSQTLNISEIESGFEETSDKTALVPVNSMDPDNGGFSDDSTQDGVSSLSAFLRLQNDGTEEEHELTDGNTVVGRDASCDIQIKNKSMSRRHFEVNKDSNNYFIVDLGSANGTLLNGNPVSKNQPRKIESGDIITISNMEISFEVVDTQFQNKLQLAGNLPAPVAAPSQFQGPAQNQMVSAEMPLPPVDAGAKVIKLDDNNLVSQIKNDPKKKKMFLAGTAAVLLLAALFSGPEKKSITDKGQKDSSSQQVTFDKLTNEQKAIVKDTLDLARNQYTSGKYKLCQDQVKKLHNIIPFYNDSKDLEKLCAQAFDLQKIQEEKQRQREEQAKIKQKIIIVAEDCKSQMNQFQSMDDLKKCLLPAMELNPDASEVAELITQMKILEQSKLDQKARAAELARVRSLGKGHYNKAKKLYKKGELRNAIITYQKFLGKSYPLDKSYNENAKRELASARKQLSVKVNKFFGECKKLYDSNKYKESIYACDGALKEDPANSEVQQYRRFVLSELRKEMKTIYEDSILEESLGNVDSAKEKWKKIMELNIKTDEYYNKAKIKLRRYGIGI